MPSLKCSSPWISMPAEVCLGNPLNVSMPQVCDINHVLDHTCFFSYLNSFMISNTTLLWMNPKYTSSSTVYRSIHLGFHEDIPTLPQTSHDQSQFHSLSHPPVCFCHWPHGCFSYLSSWSLGPTTPSLSLDFCKSCPPSKLLLH